MWNFDSSLSRSDAECIFCFDELKIKNVMEYDPSAVEVIGPYILKLASDRIGT